MPWNGNETRTYYAIHIKHYQQSKLSRIGPYGRVSKDITWAYYLRLISNAILVYRYTVAGDRVLSGVRSFHSHSKPKPSNECMQLLSLLEFERANEREGDYVYKLEKSAMRLIVAVAILFFFFSSLFRCQRQVCPARIVQLNSKLHFDRWSWLVIIFRWKVDIIWVFIFLSSWLLLGFRL